MAVASSSPLVARAEHVADDVLFPAAQEVDQAPVVPADHLTSLAEARLWGIAAPRSVGGTDLDPALSREVFAAIGGGCGATFFVWAQHHGVVRTLAASTNEPLRNELLGSMCAGETIAGVAFAHVRRPGRPAITATRIRDAGNGAGGGWRLDGHAPWATSWGIARWFAIAAESPDGELVWAMIPGPTDGVTATPLALPLFGATGTVALDFDGCVVPDDRTALVEDVTAWRSGDRRRASIGQPAVLGVAARAVRLLDDTAHHRTPNHRHDEVAAAAAVRLRGELDDVWRCDGELLGRLAEWDRSDDDPEQLIVEASDHRTRCLDLARRATTALLAAVGGGGMDLGHPAQRLAREADFYVIQAQTADGRAATLRSV